MKIKYLKQNKTAVCLSFVLLLLALLAGSLSGLIPGGSEKIYAKISYSNYVKKLSETYCIGLAGTASQPPSQYYDQCNAYYKQGAADVYYSGKKYASGQQAKNCAARVTFPPSGLDSCAAYSAGMGEGLIILAQASDGDNSKPDKKPDKKPPKKPGESTKPPPISECNKLKDSQDKKDCRREYAACNPPPEKLSFVPVCKKQTIQKYKKKQADKEEDEQKKKKAEEDNKYKGVHLCGNIRTENNGTSGQLSDDNYYTKFNFGCVGEDGPPGLNPIEDLAFAALRFLSVGVGIAVVIAIIGSGIQYTASEGNAEVTSKAKKRIRSALIGLVFYIFAFSLFQFLVPGGIFWPGSWLDVELITRLL